MPELPRSSPRRALGRTGFVATRVGLGDLADRGLPIEACVARLRRALDAGINVVDTAPNYEDGYSEEIVGTAIADRGAGGRDGVFVVDKVDHPAQPVAPQVHASLRRLGLDHVDLFVFHNVSTAEGWHEVATRAMAELEQCRAIGEVRYVGISSHSPEILQSALDDGRCDVLMLPVGPYVDRRYVEEVLPRAKSLGVGTIGFKAFGGGKLVADSEGYGRPSRQTGLPRLSVAECVRYTLTLDADVTLLGMSDESEQDEALEAAAAFTPMTADELAATRAQAERAVQGKGAIWWDPPLARVP